VAALRPWLERLGANTELKRGPPLEWCEFHTLDRDRAFTSHNPYVFVHHGVSYHVMATHARTRAFMVLMVPSGSESRIRMTVFVLANGAATDTLPRAGNNWKARRTWKRPTGYDLPYPPFQL
jgi:hypothetical protein